MFEYTLTPLSTQRVLQALNRRKVTKVGLQSLVASDLAPRIYFINRSLHGGGPVPPGDEVNIPTLRALGVSRFIVRCNQDRDIFILDISATRP